MQIQKMLAHLNF